MEMFITPRGTLLIILILFLISSNNYSGYSGFNLIPMEQYQGMQKKLSLDAVGEHATSQRN